MKGGGGRGSGVGTGGGDGRAGGRRKGRGDWRLAEGGGRAEGEEEEGGKERRTGPTPPAAGYRASVTLVQKGCWTGPSAGQMQSNEDALPPDYSAIRGCTTDWCNADLMTHDTIPNLSPGVRVGGAGPAGAPSRPPGPPASGAGRDPHARGGTLR